MSRLVWSSQGTVPAVGAFQDHVKLNFFGRVARRLRWTVQRRPRRRGHPRHRSPSGRPPRRGRAPGSHPRRRRAQPETAQTQIQEQTLRGAPHRSGPELAGDTLSPVRWRSPPRGVAPYVQGMPKFGYDVGRAPDRAQPPRLHHPLMPFPAPAVLGAVLLTGYVGGAVATQVRLGGPWFPSRDGRAGLAGLWCRIPRLREAAAAAEVIGSMSSDASHRNHGPAVT